MWPGPRASLLRGGCGLPQVLNGVECGQIEHPARWPVECEGRFPKLTVDLGGHEHGSRRLSLFGVRTAAAGHPQGQVRSKQSSGTARELAGIMAAVGLASNLAALRALVSDGIQAGHMALHARSVCHAAGARGADAEELRRRLIVGGEVKLDRARQLLSAMAREG